MASCVVCLNPASVYCENDTAFLCKDCDTKIHSSNVLASRHLRVKVCDLCTKHKSSVYCKNDKAFLCDSCDKEVHQNNPLAVRHEVVCLNNSKNVMLELELEASFPCESSCAHSKTALGDGGLPDISSGPGPLTGSEGVVPVLPLEESKQAWDKDFELPDWLDKMDTGFDFGDILSEGNDDALVPTLSNSSNDFEDKLACFSEIGMSPKAEKESKQQQHELAVQNTVSTRMTTRHSAAAPAIPPAPVEYPNLTREERVARYREKRKNRKFQKTIRYASRKAYAEVRPRIKGRFAKREEVIAMQLAQDEEDGVVPTMSFRGW